MKRTITVTVAVLFLVLTVSFVSGTAQTEADEGLSLYRAIELALEHNPTVNEAQLSLQIAQLELEATQASSYIPTIGFNLVPPSLSSAGFSGGWSGAFSAQVSLPWGTQADLSADLSLGLNTEQDLEVRSWQLSFAQKFDFSQPEKAAQALQAKESALTDVQQVLKQAKQSIILNVIKRFGNLLTEKLAQEQAQTALDVAQQQLTKVKSQVAAGQASQSDLLAAQLSLLDAQINLEKSKQAYASDKEAFRREMLGIKHDYDPLPIDLPLERLQSASSRLLAEEIPETAISAATEVKKAQDAVGNAEQALQALQASALPTLSIQAGLGDDGWKIGFGIAFDLFSPDRKLNIAIAQAQLKLAEQQLSAAKENVRNSILTKRTALETALQNVQRIQLEEKKWALEETINQNKLNAGLLSTADWDDFQTQKNAFYQSVVEKEISLLVAYFRYCGSLGLSVNWEDWVK